MASIQSRSGRLVVDFRYRGLRCREPTKLADTRPNRRRLQRVIDRMEAEIVLKTFDYAAYFPNSPKVEEFRRIESRVAAARRDMPSFREFAETWFVECSVGWRHSHRETIRGDLDRRLIPAFGDRPLDSITKAEVLAFRAELAGTANGAERKALAAATINRILVPLRSILNEAADRHGFPSPMSGVKTLRVPRSKVEPFTLEEVRLFLGAVRKDFRPYYTVRFFTGMRTGEVDGLKWKYVDFERRQILIRETYVMGREGYTKNDHSQREIAMSGPVHDALREQRERTKAHAFVFCTNQGKPLNYNNVAKRVWHPLLRHLGLPRRKPYQTRHTAATLWLAAGENPEWIARQMGHATTEMLFRIYSRFVPNITRRDGSAFEALLEGPPLAGEDETDG